MVKERNETREREKKSKKSRTRRPAECPGSEFTCIASWRRKSITKMHENPLDRRVEINQADP